MDKEDSMELIKKILQWNIVAVIFLFGRSIIFAQTENITVSARVDQNTNSFITITPNEIEEGFYSTIYVHVVDNSGNVLSNVDVTLYVSDSDGITLHQPQAPTDANGITTASVQGLKSGIYYISASYMSGTTKINIPAKHLIVTSIPSVIINKEPLYTQGLKNNISWTFIPGDYKYELQISKNKDFVGDIYTAENLKDNSFTATNLENSQVYFYRVRVVNSVGFKSKWSAKVFSIQDNEPPTIVNIDLSSDKPFVKAIDNGAIKSVEVLCRDDDESDYKNCGIGYQYGQDNFEIKFLDSENFNISDFDYCIYAIDMADNFSKKCKSKEPPNEVIPLESLIVTPPNTSNNSEVKQEYKLNILIGSLILAVIVWILGFTLYGLGGLWIQWLWQFIIGKHKQTSIGFVYDSQTKEPLYGVKVLFFDSNHKKVYQYISDVNGEIHFPKGKKEFSYIEIRSKDYSFPSMAIDNDKKDIYGNVYLGDKLQSTPNYMIIPVDQTSKFLQNLKKFSLINKGEPIMKNLARLLYLFSIAGFILSIPFLQKLVLLVWGILLTYDFLYIVFTFTVKKYGYSYLSAKFSQLLSGVRVDLIDKQKNIMFMRYTNKIGMYRFIVPGGNYELRIWNHADTKPSIDRDIQINHGLHILKSTFYSVN